ncbi:hypothetical protein [Chitinilyticum piscinae]|nr:hypothetical protein [Chitinilyticum piscinae]
MTQNWIELISSFCSKDIDVQTQARLASIKSIEFTDTGVFVDFEIEIPKQAGLNFSIHGVQFYSENLSCSASGFLHIRDGTINTLELVSNCGESLQGMALTAAKQR